MKTIVLILVIIFSAFALKAQTKSEKIYKSIGVSVISYTDMETGEIRYALYAQGQKYGTASTLISIYHGDIEGMIELIDYLIKFSGLGKDVSQSLPEYGMHVSNWKLMGTIYVYIDMNDDIDYALLKPKILTKIKKKIADLNNPL